MKIPVFAEHLGQILLKEEADKKQERSKDDYRHYPSSASIKLDLGSGTTETLGSCLRAIWYRAKQTKESNPVDWPSLLKMGLGDAVHDWFIRKLQKIRGMVIMPESGGRVILDDLTKEVSFRVDALVTYDGKLGAIELKTVQGRSFSYMDGPKNDHLLQIISYFGLNPTVDWFSLIYIGRDNGFMTEYHITRHAEDRDRYFCEGVFPRSPKVELRGFTFKSIVSRWKELETYLQGETEPPRDYKVVFDKEGKITERRTKAGRTYKSDFHCTYCPFLNYCWSRPGAQADSVFIPMTATERDEWKSKVIK